MALPPENQITETDSRISWDNGQPVSQQFNDVYFSKHNGLEESRYVFLKHNQLAERFGALDKHEHFIVGETGFGTGLNFLACWQVWQQQAPSSAHLHFISVEKFPLTPIELKRSLDLWPELNALSRQLIDAYEQQLIHRQYQAYYHFCFGNIRLHLLVNDAEDGLKQLLSSQHLKLGSPHWPGVDAWFLDGFAPAKNPDMWKPSLLALIAHLSHTDTSFSTFTSAGQVRRNLLQAGFVVNKCPGYGNKRDMLAGTMQATNPAAINIEEETPWTTIKNYHPQPQSKVAIIGAGLAGCHTANALAQRGVQVWIFDREEEAQAASGNPQGIVYGKLSNERHTLGNFNLSALLSAQAIYSEFWRNHPTSGEQCGVLQLSQTEASQTLHKQIATLFAECQWVDYLNTEQASQIAKVKLPYPALYFPYCGWLNPVDLCKDLLAHPLIKHHNYTQVNELNSQGKSWLLKGTQGHGQKKQEWHNDGFDAVVIANANDANTFSQCQWLPIKSIRGQISYLESNEALEKLSTVVCGRGYIAPSTSIANITESFHTVGASFNLHDQATELSMDDHQGNLQHMQQCFSEMHAARLLSQPEPGRVGFRCTSPDYLPLVGPIPDKEAFLQDFAGLSKNARNVIPRTGQYHSGLYLNIAHGSRGLVYTPLAANIIASLITGEPPPCDQSIIQGLNPARFLIRDLIRRQSRYC